MSIGFKVALSVTDGVADAETPFSSGLTLVVLAGQEYGEVETTDHNQANDIKQFDPTLLDPGTTKVELKATAANITRVRALRKITKTWKITAPAGTAFGATTPQSFSATGWVKKVDETPFEREGEVMFKFEIRMKSDWTVAGGT